MKKYIKFFALLLIFSALIFVVGCRKKDVDNTDNNGTTENGGSGNGGTTIVTIVSIEIDETTIPESVLTIESANILETIKLKVNKSDNSVETINVSKSMISESDLAKITEEGTHKITVKYENLETSFNLVVKKPEVTVKDPIEYSVLIKDIAGKPLSDFYVIFYQGDEIVNEGYTDAEGVFSCNLIPDFYEVIVEENEGYYLNQSLFETDLIGTQIEVVCEIVGLEGVYADKYNTYELGDVMYDFNLTDIDGNELKLYDLLDTYEVVILNFWYTTCSYCSLEFPYMVSAYESSYEDEFGNTVAYKDKVAIIAVNPTIAGVGDTVDAMKSYRDGYGISFNVAPDYDLDDSNLTMDPALTLMFGIEGYPSTVVIDKFGLIASIHSGAITTEEKWTQTFDEYLDPAYTPEYNGDSILGGGYKEPDITQAESSVLEEAVNGTNYDGSQFECTFAPEDNDDAKYSWPWVVEEFNGKTCIKPSNQGYDPSYSIVYVTVYLHEGDVFTFDYFASTESYDVLYVTANGSIATSISGMSPDWETSYAYIAIEDGEYELGFVYMKDSSYFEGEDAVYLTNLRILRENDIDKVTYIFRECATGTINQFTMSYPNYADVYYNEEDGYYHVNSVDGPLLLADMLSGTQWNNSDLYSISLEGLCADINGVDYTAIIEKYAIVASNSSIGYCPVTLELADALKQITKALGHEYAANNSDQWLEVCVYYSAYGTGGVELGVPTVGVCFWEPIMFDGDGYNTPAKAEATFDRIILPRGFIFGFNPTVSGVYKFYSTEEMLETLGWICDSDGNVIAESEYGLRAFAEQTTKGEMVDNNFVAYVYLEAGQTYLFRAAFYDVSEYSTITVEMNYVDEVVELLTVASPGFFTSSDDEMADIISGNYVDVYLGEDGFYHVANSLASDDFVYCDFKYINNITGYSLEICLSDKFNAFDFSKDEYNKPIYDEEGYYRVTSYDENDELISYYVCVDAEGTEYYVKSIGEDGYTEENGYTYLMFDLSKLEMLDCTEIVKKYIEENMITDEESELYGCVKVNEEFAMILGLLMDKYTFAGIDYSWVKLCYYFKYVGPVAGE